MHDVLLKVRNLKKIYRNHNQFFFKPKAIPAVDDVSFSIARGGIMGIIGESGCGKSTLAKTLLQLIPPNGGSAVFDGTELFDVEKGHFLAPESMQALRKEMQIVFQDPYAALDPKRNILETVAEGALKHHVMPRKNVREHVLRHLEACGISADALQHYPHEFSGGQRQRINIARSLAMNPSFLVCDEVTAALDVSIQSQILNLLLDLRDKYNLTIMVISHNIDVVRYLCDTVAVMYLGKVVEMAIANQLYTTPMHPYTKMLLSSVPIRHPGEKKMRDLTALSMPDNRRTPNGCRFSPRCMYCTERCQEESPSLMEVAQGRWVACWNRNG